jgi:aspartate racemase
MKTIGILGGMGPFASITFYRSVIDISGFRHGAVRNDDYPHMLISNLPVPDLIASRESEDIAVRMVEEEVRRLASAGADFLVLTCNTMHLYLDRFRRASSVRILSMVDAVVEAILRDGRRKVGILGSATSIQSGLYAKPLIDVGVRCLDPSSAERDLLSALIMNNIAGNVLRQEERAVYAIIDRLRERGAEAIILGCTELPLVLEGGRCSLPVYDSLRLLAEAACREIYGDK